MCKKLFGIIFFQLYYAGIEECKTLSPAYFIIILHPVTFLVCSADIKINIDINATFL